MILDELGLGTPWRMPRRTTYTQGCYDGKCHGLVGFPCSEVVAYGAGDGLRANENASRLTIQAPPMP